MFKLKTRGQQRAKRGSACSARPRLEALEGRELLSATPLSGGQWAYGTRITYSFAPDGTSVGGVANNMNATLNASYGSSAWQQDIKKAFALWSNYANLNVTQVSDNGTAFGASGNQQGDSRFGDIRIAMIPQGATGTLAYAMLPPPVNGGTNAGDIVFNSNYKFGVGGYDLQTVAIHEVGHALGLDHAAIASDVMYAYYNGAVTTVSADDAAALASAYGTVSKEVVNNGTAATATAIAVDAAGKASRSGLGLAGTADQDWYSVTAPANTSGTLTVKMQTDALSSASPRFNIVASNGTTILAQAAAPNVYGTTVTASIPVTAGTTYYIRSLTASSGAGSYGAYGLLINFGTTAQAAIAPPNTVVYQTADNGGSALALKDSSGQTLLQQIYDELSQTVEQLQSQNWIAPSLKAATISDLMQVTSKLLGKAPGAKELVEGATKLIKALTGTNKADQLELSSEFLSNVFHSGTMTTFADAFTIGEMGGQGHGRVAHQPEPLSLVSSGKLPGVKVSRPGADLTPIVIITPADGTATKGPDLARRPIRRPFPFF